MMIDVVILLVCWGGIALLLYSKGMGYKENLRVIYNCSSSMTKFLVFPNYKI
jgi:hypothetical protein